MIILVLNQGLKSTRCIAFDESGQSLASNSKPIHTAVSNERVEQDPAQWLELARAVIQECVRQLGPRAEDIAFLTVTTSASCLVMVDKQGQHLGHSILVSDTRAEQEARNLENTVEYQEAFSGRIKCSPDLMLPKILWLRAKEPERFEKTARFLNAGDFLIAHLTGEYVTDPNNALKFHYSISRNAYPEKLLLACGLSSALLPRVAAMGTEVGPIRQSVRRELGIPESCRVILSTYDAMAAVVGTGVFDVGEAVDVGGTVTSFRAVSDRQVFDARLRIYVTPHVQANRWLLGGSTNLGGGVIEWLRQLLYEEIPDAYEVMAHDAASQPPCPGGLIFLPHLLGERCPLWNPACRGVFFGLNRAHRRMQMTRSVFEGVAFSARLILSVLQEFDVPIHSVTVSGGLARIDVLSQIKSDVFGVPVKKLDNFETTAVGAAMICLIRQGLCTEREAAARFCRIERVFEPDASHHGIYSDFFGLFQQVYASLLDAYEHRARLLRSLQAQGINELHFTENL